MWNPSHFPDILSRKYLRVYTYDKIVAYACCEQFLQTYKQSGLPIKRNHFIERITIDQLNCELHMVDCVWKWSQRVEKNEHIFSAGTQDKIGNKMPYSTF